MRLGKTRLPIPTDEYERAWGDQLIRAIDQNIDAVLADITDSAGVTGYYGSFLSTVTQTAAAINTPYAMTFNSTSMSNQIGLVSNSRITFKNRGTYNIQFSAQLDQTSGTPRNAYIWFRQNGTNIPSSASMIAIQGATSESVVSRNFVVSVLGGDYVEIMWAADDTAVRLLADPSNAFRPAIPSVIATAVSV